MKKDIFIKDLKSELSGLDKKELERILQYYNEYFDEMKINDNDEIDDDEFDVKFLANEIIEEDKGGIKRRIEEFSYNDNDILSVEENLKNPKTSIGEFVYHVKNDKELRNRAYERIFNYVNKRVKEDKKLL